MSTQSVPGAGRYEIVPRDSRHLSLVVIYLPWLYSGLLNLLCCDSDRVWGRGEGVEISKIQTAAIGIGFVTLISPFFAAKTANPRFSEEKAWLPHEKPLPAPAGA